MSIKNCMRLALKNIKSSPKTVFKVIASFTSVFVCIICFFGYTMSVNTHINDMTENMASCNYLEADGTVPIADMLSTYSCISEAKQRSNVLINGEITSVEIDNIIMEAGNVKYCGINDYSNYFQIDFSYGTSKDAYSVYFDIEAYNTDYSVFTKNDLKEYTSKSGKTEYIKGNMISGAKQLLISDYMLERFGISKKDYDNFINKEVSFYLADADKPILEKYILVGIIDSDLFHTISGSDASQIIVSDNNTELSYEEGINYVQYYTDSFSDTYGLSIMLSSDSIYNTPSLYVENYNSVEKQQSISNRLIYIVTIFLIIALSVSVITVVYFYNSERTKYTAMILAIGLRRGKLFLIHISEVIIEGYISLIIGTALSVILIILFNLYFSETIGVYLSFNISQIAIMGLMVLIYILLLSLSVSVINFIKFKKNSISDILSEE